MLTFPFFSLDFGKHRKLKIMEKYKVGTRNVPRISLPSDLVPEHWACPSGCPAVSHMCGLLCVSMPSPHTVSSLLLGSQVVSDPELLS